MKRLPLVIAFLLAFVPVAVVEAAGVNVTGDNPGGGQTYATKTITADGTSGNGATGSVALFTVSGGVVVVDDIVGRVSTNLTGAASTLALGTTNQTSLFIAATTATTLTTTANPWASTTATQGGILVPAALFQGAYVSQNIIITVAAANWTGGVLEIDCLWHPLTSGATLQ